MSEFHENLLRERMSNPVFAAAYEDEMNDIIAKVESGEYQVGDDPAFVVARLRALLAERKEMT